MRGIRLYAIVAAAFMAGAFLVSPELRAYAANTVGSADIINNSILSADIKDGEVKTVDLGGNAVTSAKIKDGEVKTADIATGAVAAGRIADGAVGTLKIADDSIMAVDIQADAVGASEIAGVTKFIFEECTVNGTLQIPAGGTNILPCAVQGVEAGDGVIATKNTATGCFDLVSAVFDSANNVRVAFRNDCSISVSLGTVKVAIIVFNK